MTHNKNKIKTHCRCLAAGLFQHVALASDGASEMVGSAGQALRVVPTPPPAPKGAAFAKLAKLAAAGAGAGGLGAGPGQGQAALEAALAGYAQTSAARAAGARGAAAARLPAYNTSSGQVGGCGQS